MQAKGSLFITWISQVNIWAQMYENGEWRRLHNEGRHRLYRSPNIVTVINSRRLRWAGHVARMEEGRNAFKVVVGKPIGKRPSRRPRLRWEDNIIINLKEFGISTRY